MTTNVKPMHLDDNNIISYLDYVNMIWKIINSLGLVIIFKKAFDWLRACLP